MIDFLVELLKALVEVVILPRVGLGLFLDLELVVLEMDFMMLNFLVKLVDDVFLLLIFLVEMLNPLGKILGVLFDSLERILEILVEVFKVLFFEQSHRIRNPNNYINLLGIWDLLGI